MTAPESTPSPLDTDSETTLALSLTPLLIWEPDAQMTPDAWAVTIARALIADGTVQVRADVEQAERDRAAVQRVEALAAEWERKWHEHIQAAVDADSKGLAGLQVAAGSVRGICAKEVRAALRGDL